MKARHMMCGAALAFVAGPALGSTLAASGVSGGHISAHLESEVAEPAPGMKVGLAIVMEPANGWHGYWKNPGDAGLPLSLTWDVPVGIRMEKTSFPIPQTFSISGMMNYVFEGDYAVLTSFRMPKDARLGSVVPIHLKASWLACSEMQCVPEKAEMTLPLKVGNGLGKNPFFKKYRSSLPSSVLKPSEWKFNPDGSVRLTVKGEADLAKGKPYLFVGNFGGKSYGGMQEVSTSGADLLIDVEGLGFGPDLKRLDGVLRVNGGRGFKISALRSDGAPGAKSKGPEAETTPDGKSVVQLEAPAVFEEPASRKAPKVSEQRELPVVVATPSEWRALSYGIIVLLAMILGLGAIVPRGLYGSRSHRNQKLLDGVRKAVEESAPC